MIHPALEIEDKNYDCDGDYRKNCAGKKDAQRNKIIFLLFLHNCIFYVLVFLFFVPRSNSVVPEPEGPPGLPNILQIS